MTAKRAEPTSQTSRSLPRSGVASGRREGEPASAPRSTPRVLGDYTLQRQLGSGAMGEVWLARHTATGSRAAVKLLHPHIASEARIQAFFARERRAIGRLSHPHVLRLHDVGPSFIVTAYIEGTDLARRLHTPCDPAQAVRWALQIASALDHAHGRGVVHRDVKPSNILIDLRGNAYLADFGLATLVDDPDGAAPEDRAGTPAFMAPEQARAGAVGPAADQYALGRTLIEMLCGGSVPTDPADALAQLPSTLPRSLSEVLRRATAPEAADRWDSVNAFAEALAAVDLGDCGAPVRLAPELRVRTPFAWCIGPSSVEPATPDVVRADYRLDDLERAGLLTPERCAAFRALTGYAQVGWSVFGHTGRLGPLTNMSALARATDIVVLLHGMFCSRQEWIDVALAICRDNALAVVLVPDLLGCGESRFLPDAPSATQISPRGMARTALALLDLLSVRDLPCVLVGHSIAGTALLSVGDGELGERISRIAITPVYPEDTTMGRGSTRAWARVIGAVARVGALKRFMASSIHRRPDIQDLPDGMKERMVAEFLRASPTVLKLLFGQLADARPASADGLHRCLVLVGEDDPLAPPARTLDALTFSGLPAATVEHLIGNGHYPHADNDRRPERTGRNVADLARYVETMLTTSREGSPLSTLVASTLLEPARATPPSDGRPTLPSATLEAAVTSRVTVSPART